MAQCEMVSRGSVIEILPGMLECISPWFSRGYIRPLYGNLMKTWVPDILARKTLEKSNSFGRIDKTDFHGSIAVAPLKHEGRKEPENRQAEFPRLLSRGPIEVYPGCSSWRHMIGARPSGQARINRPSRLHFVELTLLCPRSIMVSIQVYLKGGTRMKTLSLSEAKVTLSRLVKAVKNTDEEVMITKNGSPAAVLVSSDEYESWKETLAIRNEESLVAEIRNGLRDLRRRKAHLYTLEELFK